MWGPGFDQKGAVVGGAGGAAQSVRGNYKSFKGIHLTVLGRMHQFIMGGGRVGRGSSICAWKLCTKVYTPEYIHHCIN